MKFSKIKNSNAMAIKPMFDSKLEKEATIKNIHQQLKQNLKKRIS
jgi:hypothetical protein